MEKPTLVLIGGFLGSGKTSLILAAARELKKRGWRSAAILNDQGDDLVDTHLARSEELNAGEVTGGCFCCRFSEFVRMADQLRAHAPRVIFAEPVGSCTDISATTLEPLRRLHADDYRIAPYTVLVDPARATALLAPEADPDLQFLFRKQIDEAELICFSKSDLGIAPPEIVDRPTRQFSAVTGQGVAAWLDEVLLGEMTTAPHFLDIDYDEYARAEASLAWLNLRLELDADPPVSPAVVLGPMLETIDEGLSTRSIAIMHMKATDESSSGMIRVAITANGQQPKVGGALDASPAERHDVLLNLRAAGDPAKVREVIEMAIARLPGTASVVRLSCFRPGRPVPEMRMTR